MSQAPMSPHHVCGGLCDHVGVTLMTVPDVSALLLKYSCRDIPQLSGSIMSGFSGFIRRPG